jgi:hypothetical protein
VVSELTHNDVEVKQKQIRSKIAYAISVRCSPTLPLLSLLQQAQLVSVACVTCVAFIFGGAHLKSLA